MNLPKALASSTGLAGVKFVSRLLFLALVLAYFLHVPVNLAALPNWALWLAAAAYLVLQGITLWWAPRHKELVSVLIDFIAFATVLVLDPGTPPPTLVLLLVTVFGSGLLYGVRRQLMVLAGSVAVIAAALTLRFQLTEAASTEARWFSPFADSATLFLLSALAICALYATVLIYRNQVLRKQADAATWQDPDTLLLSRAALLSTASWLLPLHERISAPLCVVLLKPEESSPVTALADALINRIRRSDVAARVDQDTIALMLPHTQSEAAEGLIRELHQQQGPFYAALASLESGQHTLESVLTQLDSTLQRAESSPVHWLVHASLQG